MRVAGYVREPPGSDNGQSAYAQSERIRRWATRGGHALVAVSQDVPQPGYPMNRAGYRALLGIVDAGQVDVVLLADLDVLSPDKIIQEVMLWDLRARGVSVLTTEDAELEVLSDPSPDAARLLIRDVLARVAQYDAEVEEVPGGIRTDAPDRTESPLGPEVVVELVPEEEAS